MSSNLDIFALKGQAKALVADAKAEGNTIGHTQALEQVARNHGFKSWNLLLGLMKPGQREKVVDPANAGRALVSPIDWSNINKVERSLTAAEFILQKYLGTPTRHKAKPNLPQLQWDIAFSNGSKISICDTGMVDVRLLDPRFKLPWHFNRIAELKESETQAWYLMATDDSAIAQFAELVPWEVLIVDWEGRSRSLKGLRGSKDKDSIQSGNGKTAYQSRVNLPVYKRSCACPNCGWRKDVGAFMDHSGSIEFQSDIKNSKGTAVLESLFCRECGHHWSTEFLFSGIEDVQGKALTLPTKGLSDDDCPSCLSVGQIRKAEGDDGIEYDGRRLVETVFCGACETAHRRLFDLQAFKRIGKTANKNN